MKNTILILMLSCICGCATHRYKECNLVELQHAHPDMGKALDEYPSLMMDMMKRITILEQECGEYR
jgi:hypothetical protein